MNENVKDCYDGGVCPDCNQAIPDEAVEGDECSNCGHVFWLEVASSDCPGEGVARGGTGWPRPACAGRQGSCR
jgi:hypothetical protein